MQANKRICLIHRSGLRALYLPSKCSLPMAQIETIHIPEYMYHVHSCPGSNVTTTARKTMYIQIFALPQKRLYPASVYKFKACVHYFLSKFYFSLNDCLSKTMKNILYLILKALFVLEIFRFLYFCLPLSFPLSPIALEIDRS